MSDQAECVNPILVLRARAEARAMLYAAGELDLIEAVEPLLQSSAELIEALGETAARAIILHPFKAFMDG